MGMVSRAERRYRDIPAAAWHGGAFGKTADHARSRRRRQSRVPQLSEAHPHLLPLRADPESARDGHDVLGGRVPWLPRLRRSEQKSAVSFWVWTFLYAVHVFEPAD